MPGTIFRNVPTEDYPYDYTWIGTSDPEKMVGGLSPTYNIMLYYAGGGNDVIGDYPGIDVIYGEAGNDTLYGGLHNDSIYGGLDNDYIGAYSLYMQMWRHWGNDYFDGGLGSDVLEGGAGNDTFLGGSENDYLFGGFGDDQLTGGTGADYLSGASGRDAFFFQVGDTGDFYGGQADTIQGISAEDTIFIYTGQKVHYAYAGNTDQPGENQYSLWQHEGKTILTYNSALDGGWHDIVLESSTTARPMVLFDGLTLID